jgi:predicted translation initiation factor SUI1
MAKRNDKIVLFLCTGNYYRSRFAEVLFNSLAAKMGLPWKAWSRALALERGVHNVGPMAPSAVKALEALGIRGSAEVSRFPVQTTIDDLEGAAWIVAVKEAEHLPLLQERFPTWTDKVEFWHVEDDGDALPLIEKEVTDLAARLIAGGRPRKAGKLEVVLEIVEPKGTPKAPERGAVVRLGRETKGRHGKGVTIVSDIPLDEAGLLELAAKLKQRCGTGGTVKDGRIEIQGDQRARLTEELQGMGYRVKRVGG